MRSALLPLLLVVSACGGGAALDTIPTTTATSPTTIVRVRPEGEPAPDFSLALGEGGTFTLSEETRPVFLLFWAEW